MNEYGLHALLVSVNYSDILSLTLPWNRHHFKSVSVISTNVNEVEDAQLRKLCGEYDARLAFTDKFKEGGAVFNKWAAVEWALDYLNLRDSWWITLMDADVFWPKILPRHPMERGKLYSPLRRMHESLTERYCHSVPGVAPTRPFPPETLWSKFPVHRNVGEWAGYTQIFHTNDPALLTCGNCGHLRSRHGSDSHCKGFVWHQTDWTHAGGADSFFQQRWQSFNKVRPPWEVLHLGPAGANWCGRVSPLVGGGEVPEAGQRQQLLNEVFRRRVGKHGLDRFKHERLNG